MLRILLGLAGPLIKLLGVSALQTAMDELRAQFDRIEAKQADFETRLARMEKRDDAFAKGMGWMEKARAVGKHADAATPRLPGETNSQYARRVFPAHAKDDDEASEAANVEGEDGDPPESHV